MPALGYFPSGQFAFPRSYIRGITIRHDIAPPVWFASGVQFWIAGTPPASCFVEFKPLFTTWSSNRYTLDWIVQDAKYSYPPDPTLLDLPYYLVYGLPADRHFCTILFDVSYGSSYTTHDLPAQPGGYWLPPPLPT